MGIPISYFVDNQKHIMRKLSCGMIVSSLLDPLAYRIYKRLRTPDVESDGEYIFIKQVETGKIIHQFFFKDNEVEDYTCDSPDCECLFAVAIKFNWLELKGECYPLTEWVPVGAGHVRDAHFRFRWLLRKGETKIHLKSRHFGKSMEMYPTEFDSLSSLGKLEFRKGCKTNGDKAKLLIEKGDKRLLNLRNLSNVNISKQLRKDLGFKVEFDDETNEL